MSSRVTKPLAFIDGVVIINVLDLNDNPPYFTPANYTADVPEDTAVGTTLFTLNATDADLAENGLEGISLINGVDSSHFRLARTDDVWTVVLRSEIDFDTKQRYTAQV